MSRTSDSVTSLSRKQRFASLGLGAALNLAALLALISFHTHRPKVQKDAGMSSVSIAPQTSHVRSIKLPTIKSANSLTDPLPAFEPFSAEEQALLGLSTDYCSVLDSVALAVVSDPKAVDAIVHAPLETRSIADAIVIWNVDWSAATAEPEGPLKAVRTNVTETLQMAPPECLSSPILGPRLVPIPNGDRTLFLVFGSGEWSWNALLEPEPTNFWDLPDWLG
ncbi:MAG: hypothetical protein H0W71_00990 [Sphingomonas sp.]|nr:hypothetical protein [Sphingomonas sp.]